MDDIAGSAGVSKKTIYQHYKDKTTIVSQVVISHFKLHRKLLMEATARTENCIEELYEMSKCLKQQTESVNPAVIYDLERFYPKAFADFEDFKKKFILDMIRTSLIRGIEEGYFRADLDVEIIAVLRMAEVQLSFDPNLYPREKFDFQKVHIQLFRHFALGLLTDNGRVLFKHYFDEEHEA